jgi:hypothetical protein
MSKSSSTSSSASDVSIDNGLDLQKKDSEVAIEQLRVNFTAQLDEIEILASMYSMPGEFYLHDPEAKAQLEDFCMDKSPIVPSEITYDIRLQCESALHNTVEPVEVVATVTYPLNYPDKVIKDFVYSFKFKKKKFF